MTMPPLEPNSTSAELLHKSMGITSTITAHLIAGQVVRVVWKHAPHGPNSEPPKPLDAEYPLRAVLVAAALHGATFALVKAATQRAGAHLFQRMTGEWPAG